MSDGDQSDSCCGYIPSGSEIKGPTMYPPGSPQKVEVMKVRAMYELPLFNPSDAKKGPSWAANSSG